MPNLIDYLLDMAADPDRCARFKADPESELRYADLERQRKSQPLGAGIRSKISEAIADQNPDSGMVFEWLFSVINESEASPWPRVALSLSAAALLRSDTPRRKLASIYPTQTKCSFLSWIPSPRLGLKLNSAAESLSIHLVPGKERQESFNEMVERIVAAVRDGSSRLLRLLWTSRGIRSAFAYGDKSRSRRGL